MSRRYHALITIPGQYHTGKDQHDDDVDANDKVGGVEAQQLVAERPYEGSYGVADVASCAEHETVDELEVVWKGTGLR